MALSSLFSHLDPDSQALSDYIRNIFGFRPNNIELYKLAFTHKSKSTETLGTYHLSNERLEYLGDAVLSLSVADYLFHTFPTQAEGFLTEMRSRIVSRASLNRLSQKLGFNSFIRRVDEAQNELSFKSVGGNTFEAVMGAIYLDKGFEFTKDVIIKRIILVHIDLDAVQQTETNFKSKLLQWVQKRKKRLEYRLLDESGEDHQKTFHVQVFIDDKPYAEAYFRSIRGAEQIAAEKTLNMLTKSDKD